MKYLKLFEDFNQEKIDNILDKISANGYDSLSNSDKDYLDKISGKKREIKEEPIKKEEPKKVKTGKLIDHLSERERNWLQKRIDNPGVYSMPTMAEVISYLEETNDNEDSEEVMDDLIIQYLEDEGLMFELC
jgi:hypothetical protein